VGLRVVDLSTVLAGPLCTMLLADLGADVVKVEPRDGDATRTWGPPWVGDGDARTAAYYLSVNRNKRSIRLDLGRPAAREVVRRLLQDADVLVENFRVGGLARLGFNDEALEAINPGLIHLAISGYGSDGPDASRPGYDFVVQAGSGLMSITGFPDDAGGAPTKVGVAIGDVATGLHGAIGILAALHARDEAASAEMTLGRGQRVDVSILESTLAVLVNQAQNAFATGRPPTRLGNAHPNIVPYETFETADGEIALAVGSDRQWRSLCEALETPELATDARSVSNGDRVEHRSELRPLLADRLRQRLTAEWLALLDRAGVPAGPVRDIVQAFASPQAVARQMTVELEHPVLGPVPQVGLPITLSRTPGAIVDAPPLLGEHTMDVLVDLGYDSDAIERLRADGAI